MPGRPKEFDPATALAAATDHFWSHGYEAANLPSLLQAMKLSRQSAYDTFGSKRQLFLAALTTYLAGISSQVAALLSNPAQSPLTRIHTFLDFLTDIASSPSRGCLLTNTIVELAPHDEEVRTLTSQTLANLESALTTTLKAAQKQNELSPDADPKGLARLLVLTFEGGLVVTKTTQAGSVKSAVKTLKSLLPKPT